MDNLDGTVTDNLTGLVWEQKTDDDTMHDKDNIYKWALGNFQESGTAFSSFLSNLNNTAFGGSQGWRMPTLAELQTLVLEAFPCTTSPCIAPVFGPTILMDLQVGWTSSTYANGPTFAWYVSPNEGFVGTDSKGNFGFVRAVRAGS